MIKIYCTTKLRAGTHQEHPPLVGRVVFQQGGVLEPELDQARERPQVVDVGPAFNPAGRQVQRGQLTEANLPQNWLISGGLGPN